jgi:hypothetical protein
VCGQCGEAVFDGKAVDAIQDALASLDVHAQDLSKIDWQSR